MSTPRRHDDPLMESLATLPPVLPSEPHADQLRVRCRALLERPPRQMAVTLEPVTVGAACAMYAWQIVRMLLAR